MGCDVFNEEKQFTRKTARNINVGDTVFFNFEDWGRPKIQPVQVVRDIIRFQSQTGIGLKIDGYNNYIDAGWFSS